MVFRDTEVHLRYMVLDGILKSVGSALLSRVTEEERKYAKTLQRWEDQLASLGGRVLVRSMLSELAEEPKTGWMFDRTSTGKPFLLQTSAIPDLRFNLSHTRGLVVAAVTIGRDVGVDAEFVSDTIDYLDVARAYFSQSELAIIQGAPDDRQRETFFALWTVKEAYLKARGEGLTVGLSDFSCSLEPLALSDSELQPAEPECWFFWRDRPGPEHLVALAARKAPGEALVCRPAQVALRDLL